MRHEALGACPLCGSAARTRWHEALADDTYRAVEGTWTLWRCGGCGCAYLDPRPDRASIGQAYARYYTHAAPPAAPAAAASWPGRLRRAAEAAYLRRVYGLDGGAGSAVAAALYHLLVPHRRAADALWRHLPGPGRGRRLLDVGCGDGAFLRRAAAAGWQASGLEPDPQAAAEARRQGLRVLDGGLEALASEAAAYDVITLSHVIEHLHDPVAALADCHRLLRPGGVLWLATPNVHSAGHAAFGRHWRGLEAPRHLVLSHERALRQRLHAAGFAAVRRLPPPLGEPVVLARASHALALGRHPHDAPPPLPPALRRAAWGRVALGLLMPSRREFLYLQATRAG